MQESHVVCSNRICHLLIADVIVCRNMPGFYFGWCSKGNYLCIKSEVQTPPPSSNNKKPLRLPNPSNYFMVELVLS